MSDSTTSDYVVTAAAVVLHRDGEDISIPRGSKMPDLTTADELARLVEGGALTRVTYAVTVPMIVARTPQDVYLHEGAIVPDSVPPEELQRLIEGGWVARVEVTATQDGDADA